jgi:hypothetical protein
MRSNPPLIKSKIYPDRYYAERDDVYHQLYYISDQKFNKLGNGCINTILLPKNMPMTYFKKFAKLLGKIYSYNENTIFNKSDRVLQFESITTPIDRAHLNTLSVMFGFIEYLYYEMGNGLYGYETYSDVGDATFDKYDSEEFLYIYADKLGIIEEVNEQVQIVNEFLETNNLSVDDIMTGDAFDQVDVDGHTLGDIITNVSWFFDPDGLKRSIIGG